MGSQQPQVSQLRRRQVRNRERLVEQLVIEQAPRQDIELSGIKSSQVQLHAERLKFFQFLTQHLFIPACIKSKLVIGQGQSFALHRS